jgi:hypothetical protein
MAPVEISPIGSSGASDREPGKRAAPGVITVLDGGVPWVREQAELDFEWDRITRAAVSLLVDGQFVYERIDGGGLALLGVMAAARWSTGRIDTAPMTNQAETVTGASIRRQLALAEARMVARGEDWEHATGVVTWLLWVTGVREDLVFPGWDAAHSAAAAGPTARRP